MVWERVQYPCRRTPLTAGITRLEITDGGRNSNWIHVGTSPLAVRLPTLGRGWLCGWRGDGSNEALSPWSVGPGAPSYVEAVAE